LVEDPQDQDGKVATKNRSHDPDLGGNSSVEVEACPASPPGKHEQPRVGQEQQPVDEPNKLLPTLVLPRRLMEFLHALVPFFPGAGDHGSDQAGQLVEEGPGA
jgi:hypothetical protein